MEIVVKNGGPGPGSTVPPAGGSYILKPAAARNAHVGARSEWKDTLSHHQFTCSRRSLLFSRKEGHAHNLHAWWSTLILDSKTPRCDVTTIRQELIVVDYWDVAIFKSLFIHSGNCRRTVMTFPWQTPGARVSKYLPPKAGRSLPSATAIKSYCFCDALASL